MCRIYDSITYLKRERDYYLNQRERYFKIYSAKINLNNHINYYFNKKEIILN